MLVLLAACVVELTLPRGDCSYVATPELGTWTVPPAPEGDCVCSGADTDCHALYRMRVVQADAEDVLLEVEKTTGEAPGSDRRWWLLAAPTDPPSCLDLYAYDVVLEGTWPAGQARLQLDLPATAPYVLGTDDAGGFLLATDGADRPGYVEWFASPGVRVELDCALDPLEGAP